MPSHGTNHGPGNVARPALHCIRVSRVVLRVCRCNENEPTRTQQPHLIDMETRCIMQSANAADRCCTWQGVMAPTDRDRSALSQPASTREQGSQPELFSIQRQTREENTPPGQHNNAPSAKTHQTIYLQKHTTATAYEYQKIMKYKWVPNIVYDITHSLNHFSALLKTLKPVL